MDKKKRINVSLYYMIFKHKLIKIKIFLFKIKQIKF